jgi:hypothetical protein
MHDVFVISIPTLAVMFGILLNRQDAISIRAEVKAENGQLRSEIISLRDNIHRDMMGIHERVATVESKQDK